ncbi:MAG: hypothetical protein KF819_08945 [Labilithrix sp.]|nr:hypothetical protein [Labilithrix sp.]
MDLIALFDFVDGAVFSAEVESLAVTLRGARSGERLGRPCDVAIDAAEFWRFVPDHERAEVLEVLRAVAADGVARSIEHPARIAGRPDAWFRTSARALDADDGPRLVGVIMDITNVHHVETQSLEIESWLVALGETMPLDFWICDLDGACVLQNPASRHRRGNLLGRTSPDWDRCTQRALRGESTREELVAELAGAGRHYVRIVSPVRRDGAVHAVLGVEIDVTELKETEERLRRSLAELRETQDSLVRRKQLAAMGEMSALVAHEVRNPLGVVSNALALLRRQTTGSPATELCEIIDEEVKRLDRLVANLLDSVRPMRLELAPALVEEVVDGALAHALRADGRERGIRVHRSVDHTIPPMLVDANLLDRALRNVFQNALQAMPSSGDLFLAVERELDADGAWTRVSIRDSGPGLPQDVRDRMFDPFVTTRATGSGLGLTIVRRVVEEHHGRLEISSEAGCGTTCVLRLPLPSSAG